MINKAMKDVMREALREEMIIKVEKKVWFMIYFLGIYFPMK